MRTLGGVDGFDMCDKWFDSTHIFRRQVVHAVDDVDKLEELAMDYIATHLHEFAGHPE